MFELPEYTNLSMQINQTLHGKIIRKGTLGNSPHKFVWYNQTHVMFEKLTQNTRVKDVYAKGRWLFMSLEPGYVMLIGECGGKMLYHPDATTLPHKYHLYLHFTDGSFFTVTTQMWGAIELYEKGKELSGTYVKDMKITPVDEAFSFDYFCSLIDTILRKEKKSVKGLLTQDQLIPGLGNAIAQDILFKAKLHPKHELDSLDTNQKKSLYNSIKITLYEITEQRGRYDEYDLFGNPGKYIRLMDRNALKRPCPVCHGTIKKIQYLGGTCYFCPSCQS